jgi:hypothetical protein
MEPAHVIIFVSCCRQKISLWNYNDHFSFPEAPI